MKALVVKRHGDPSVIEPEEREVPSPGVGQVLLKVRATALNHLDIWVRKGIPGIKLPIILGCDIAGEIAGLGAGVSHLKVGDRVLIEPGFGCGTCKACYAGDEMVCRHYRVIGENLDGGYAEYAVVPARCCFEIPPNLDFHEASAIPLVFLTAWHMLIGRCQAKAGETVLVIGGGSGVGSAAIQIARLFKCKVIATAGSDEKLEHATRLGADFVINHNKEKIADAVRKITGKHGADIVFEHVGPAVFGDCLSVLAQNGRLVTCGATTGPLVEVNIPRLFMKHQSIFGSIMGTKRELLDFLPFFATGELKPVIHKVMPLSEAVRAHEMIEGRKHFGKIVLDPTM